MREFPYLSDAISRVIEIYRKNSNKTKTALADFSGLERRYLLEIERGAKKPTVNAVYSICEALNVPPAEFFAKVEEERLRLRKVKGKNGITVLEIQESNNRRRPRNGGLKTAVKVASTKSAEKPEKSGGVKRAIRVIKD